MFNNNFGNVFAGSASTEDNTATYSASTERDIVDELIASYSASTERDIVDVLTASYSASTQRNLHKITTYSVLTQRTLDELASYSSTSKREVTELTTYSALTSRDIRGEVIASYSSLTQRKLGGNVSYNGSTNRKIFDIHVHSSDTERELLLPTSFKGRTLRYKFEDPDLHWTNFSEYSSDYFRLEESGDWKLYGENSGFPNYSDPDSRYRFTTSKPDPSIEYDGGRAIRRAIGVTGIGRAIWQRTPNDYNGTAEEVLVLLAGVGDRDNDDDFRTVILLRSVGLEESYRLDIRDKDVTFRDMAWNFVRESSGSTSNLTSQSQSLPISPNDYDKYWVRFRVEDNEDGDPVLKAKIWEKDTSEPDWQLTFTDTTESSLSGTGIGLHSAGGYSYIDIFSIALNGKTAPMVNPFLDWVTYKSKSERRIQNVDKYEALTHRKTSEPTFYNGSTFRLLNVLSEYNSFTKRGIIGDAIYSFSTERKIGNTITNVFSSERVITVFDKYFEGDTERISSELIDYLGSTERITTVQDLYYSGDTSRTLLESTSYFGDTDRRTSNLTDYIGDTERKTSELTTYDVLTSRTVENTASYFASTERTIEKVVYYYTDFSEYPTGEAPSDWNVIGDGGDPSIIDDPEAIGDKQLRYGGAPSVFGRSERSGLVWSEVDEPNRDEAEVLVLHMPSADVRAMVRGSSNRFYAMQVRNGNSLRRSIRAGGAISYSSQSIDPIDTSKKHWLRLRAEGDTYKAKVWEQYTQEPEEWMFEETNTTSLSLGVGVFREGTSYSTVDVFAVSTGGGTARGYPSGITGEISRSSGTSRTVKNISAYEALSVRRITTTHSYNGTTKRTVTELDEYIAQTNRTIHELTDYNAYTERDVTLMFAVEYLTATKRRVTLPIEFKSLTERILTVSTEHVGSTSRQINAIYVLHNDTQRELHRSTTYKSTTLRELRASTTFYADAERELQALTQRFSATERRSTLPTDYISTTDREIHRAVFYVGDTQRQVFSEGTVRLGFNTERIILVGSSYTDIYNDRYRTYNLESIPMRIYALSAISREFRVEEPNRQKDVEFESRTLNVKYK